MMMMVIMVNCTAACIMIRRLLRISWTQHRTNEWILQELEVERELLGRVKSLKLGYYGHTTRKYESLEKELIRGCTPGNRSRGRQRRRWTDDIIEWTGLTINEAAGPTQDRDRWRRILHATNPSSEGRHWTTTTMHYDRLLSWYCRLSVCHSVCDKVYCG